MLSWSWRKYYNPWPCQQTWSNKKPGKSILELEGFFLNNKNCCELGQHIKNHKACWVINKCFHPFIIDSAKWKHWLIFYSTLVAPLKPQIISAFLKWELCNFNLIKVNSVKQTFYLIIPFHISKTTRWNCSIRLFQRLWLSIRLVKSLVDPDGHCWEVVPASAKLSPWRKQQHWLGSETRNH